jgi:eukaryotic-like serine/threonine-protein kinase
MQTRLLNTESTLTSFRGLMTLNAGTRLGPYDILAAIGAGGMGEVYRARDPKLGRDVALKVLPEAFARDPDRMARFQREAKVLASLNHPNIAAIYGLEDSGGSNALVMELVEGPTLADRIKQGPIPIDEALRIAKQICDGLEYAHERGIVHRDLKPANIKVAHDDAVKILDFGLAKAIEGDAASQDISTSPTISRVATQAGILLGTAAYMAPEQARGKSVDRRADIWAFGCVLYEMLTGNCPFSGETVSDVLAAVLKEEPNWALLPAPTPARVRLLLQRCVQKDPKQRLRDIGDARISLEEVLSGAPEPSSPAAPASRSRRALPWALLTAALVAFAVLAALHFRQTPTVADAIRFQIPLPEKLLLPPAGAFAVSPDGRQLAFFAVQQDGIPRLWIRPMDSLEARLLPGSESTNNPAPFFWSPDSHSIVFSAGSQLKKISLSGGPAQTLCDIPKNAVGGSWNKYGDIIFGQASGALMQVSAAGGQPSPLTILDSARGEIEHVSPWFLPDGRHFLYLRRSARPQNRGVYVGSLDVKPEEQDSRRLIATAFNAVYVPSSGPQPAQLLFQSETKLQAQPFDAGHLRFAGEPVPVTDQVGSYRNIGFFSASTNGVLVYKSEGGGGTVLTWFDRAGKTLGTAGDPASYATPAFSPDGTRAAIGRRDTVVGNWVTWIFDFTRGTSTKFTFNSSNEYFPAWSSDGTRIFFASDSKGVSDIYEKLASGANEEDLLLASSEDKFPTSVSPDGRFLLYFVADFAELNRKFKLWVLPVGGNAKPIPFSKTEVNEYDGRFSPDGHFVAYRSDESGHFELYVRRFTPDPSGAGLSATGKWQVSYGGALRQTWSPDGKELFYVTSDGKVMAVPVTLNPGFQMGTPKLLFQSPPQPGRPTGEITPDGRRFLFPVPADSVTQPPFNVLLNWRALLKTN